MKLDKFSRIAIICAVLICVPSCGRGYVDSIANKATHQASTPPKVSVKLQDLLNAEVPALCDHPSGKLTNGVLGDPSSNTGKVQLRKDVIDAINANKTTPGLDVGTDENVAIAAVVACDKGGVDWPNVVVLWDKSMSLISWFDLRNTTGYRGKVDSLSLDGNEVDVKWSFAGDQDPMCCATYSAQAKVHVTRHTPSKPTAVTVERGETAVKKVIDTFQISSSSPSSPKIPTQVENAIIGVKNQGVSFKTAEVECGGGSLDGGTFKGRRLPKLCTPVTCWAPLSNSDLMIFGLERMGWNNYRIVSAYVS